MGITTPTIKKINVTRSNRFKRGKKIIIPKRRTLKIPNRQGSAAMEERSAAMEERSAAMEERSASMEERSASMEERSASMEKGSASMEKGSAYMEERSASMEKDSAYMEKGSAYMEKGSASMEKGSADIDNSGLDGFIVHGCNGIEFGYGRFIPEENLYDKATITTSGLTSTRNACFVLEISLTHETCRAKYKYLNNRYDQSSTNEMTRLAMTNLASLLYEPSPTLDEYNVAKTIEKIIKFKLIRPNQTGHFFVSIDAPKSPIGLARWHQDSTNISIISDKEVGNPPQRWRKLLNELGITHKVIPGKINEPIRSDFVLIEYLNEGISTAVEIKGDIDIENPNPDNIARFKTSPGSVILIENPGRKHTAPYMCKSNSKYSNSVDRDEGDKVLQTIMNEELERTLYRTQLSIIEKGQFDRISELISASGPINVNVKLDNIIPFDDISIDEYCSCDDRGAKYGERGGKRNKRKINKTRIKNKRRRSKRTQRKRRLFYK